MAVPLRALDPQGAEAAIAESCFPDRADERIGVEVEYLCARDDWSDVGADHAEVRAACPSMLPGGSRITWEPGGQLELSSQPFDSCAAAVAAVQADQAEVAAALRRAGVRLLPLAMEPTRLPDRVIRKGRYDAMEAYFDGDGPAGRRMMRATAAVQINVGARDPDGADRRWRVVHAIGPAMVAAFANSPLAGGGPTGWASSRFANWLLIDPTRTAPVGPGGAIEAWTRAVLDARVMLVRGAGDACEAMPSPVTFAEWMADGHELGWPDRSDLSYHLTTLFPPVRARGWLEVRYIDTSPWWDVAATVVDAVTRHRRAGEEALAACRATSGSWLRAARRGCADPALAAAAARLLHIAAETAEPRDPIGAERARDFAARFPSRLRSPADEVLDRWRSRAALHEGVRA